MRASYSRSGVQLERVLLIRLNPDWARGETSPYNSAEPPPNGYASFFCQKFSLGIAALTAFPKNSYKFDHLALKAEILILSSTVSFSIVTRWICDT